MKNWKEQETKLKTLAAEPSQLMADAIQAALGKFQTGTYGKCEDCDGAIDVVVLNERPWARLCTSCQNSLATQEMPTMLQAARA